MSCPNSLAGHMEILLINTPNRASVDTFPPYALLALKKYLQKNGVTDVDVLDVDFHRPGIDQILDLIRLRRPSILGISAVVSTSYLFTKTISQAVKVHIPETTVIVGGNLAASAEILIKQAGVDFCAIGEGENVLLNFIKRHREVGNHPAQYRDIPGLVFLDQNGDIANTGYEAPLTSEELYDMDYSDLLYGVDSYMPKMFGKDGRPVISTFAKDSRTYDDHRRGKRYFQFIIGKGCVAKCTFCHRWDKGIRHIPVDVLMKRLDALIEQYDIGYINAQIEAFACDKKWLGEFCDAIRSRDVLWEAGAVRAKSIDKTTIDRMYDSGCVSIIYGLETGSPKMLEIMEKKTTLEENIRAQELNIAKGYYNTIIQLVIGMPGESPETIQETTDFVAYCMTLSEHVNPHNLSINYVLALPGTPLYEYGRRKNLIGCTIESEEKYLLQVSDAEASSARTSINFTDYPTLEYWSWQYRIYIESNYAYVRKFTLQKYLETSLEAQNYPLFLLDRTNTGLDTSLPALIKRIMRQDFQGLLRYHPIFLYRCKSLLPYFILTKQSRRLGPRLSIMYLVEYLSYQLRRAGASTVPTKSLRKIVEEETTPVETDNPRLLPLRRGR